MRNKISAAMIIAASLGFSTMALAADGTIKFTGEITDKSCTVSNPNGTQTVALGKVAASSLSAKGVTAGVTQFSLALTACPATTASVRFDGTPDSTDSRLFALDTDQIAKGVGVAIYEDDNKTQIPVAGSSKSVSLTEGANTLNYYAKYMATGAAVEVGSANATATFTLVYQ